MLPGDAEQGGTVAMQHRHRFGRRALRLVAAAVAAMAVAPPYAAAPTAPEWVAQGNPDVAVRVEHDHDDG